MKSSSILLILMVANIVVVPLCWGAPAPPSTPVATPETLGATVALIAGYAAWKRRR